MDGPLVPIGAFKGTGLALMTDVLCGVLTGAAFGLSPYRDPTNHDVGHMLIAIDIERFMPWEEYLARVRQLCDEVRASERRPASARSCSLENWSTVARSNACGMASRLTWRIWSLRRLAAERGVPFVLDRVSEGSQTMSSANLRLLMLDPMPESEIDFVRSLVASDRVYCVGAARERR